MQRRGFTIVELLIVIVVIAILAAITIVAYTGISDRAKSSAQASTLAQWKKEAELYKVENNIECPENYVFVYGNSTLGTSDFCVMKYEAKNVGGVATSQAAGTPWTSITQASAAPTAAAACSGCHLVTELEWMTIAADVLSVEYNWSGGAVGSGLIYQGHVNNHPASALPASSNDSESSSGITGGMGTTSGANSARVLYLTSGDAVWDLVGNVWEWTDNTISGAQPGSSGYAYREYPEITSWGNLAATSRPSSLATSAGLGDIAAWNSSNGVGRIYSDSSETGTRAYSRGGGWSHTSSAGVLMLSVNASTTYSANNVGFRVAR